MQYVRAGMHNKYILAFLIDLVSSCRIFGSHACWFSYVKFFHSGVVIQKNLKNDVVKEIILKFGQQNQTIFCVILLTSHPVRLTQSTGKNTTKEALNARKGMGRN